MMTIKSAEEISKMRLAGALLYRVIEALKPLVAPGVTTLSLDRTAKELITGAGAAPSFLGYNGFKYSMCASVDDQVVHGFPTDEPLREGQIVSIDVGLVLNGWQADSAFTAAVGEVNGEAARLIRVTEECFWLAVERARPGNRLGDIGHAVQAYAEAHGYGVIRAMCGHGIGRAIHEEPNVPNVGTPGRGTRLKPGMTLAIEPMIAAGGWPVYFDDNSWTVRTNDHSLCAHYEHTVAITAGEPEILTYPGCAARKAV
jgi:methionyl aminopeptidase